MQETKRTTDANYNQSAVNSIHFHHSPSEQYFDDLDKCTSDPPPRNLTLLEHVRSNNFMHPRHQRIKPERETSVLSSCDQFREQIGDHFFRHAEMHIDIPQTHATSDQMIPDLEMPHVPQLRLIRSDV
jgi:hypothetical protein